MKINLQELTGNDAKIFFKVLERLGYEIHFSGQGDGEVIMECEKIGGDRWMKI